QPGKLHCTACTPPALLRLVTMPRSPRACPSACSSMWALAAASSTTLAGLGPRASCSRRKRCARWRGAGGVRCFTRPLARRLTGFLGELLAGDHGGGAADLGDLCDLRRRGGGVGLERGQRAITGLGGGVPLVSPALPRRGAPRLRPHGSPGSPPRPLPRARAVSSQRGRRWVQVRATQQRGEHAARICAVVSGASWRALRLARISVRSAAAGSLGESPAVGWRTITLRALPCKVPGPA